MSHKRILLLPRESVESVLSIVEPRKGLSMSDMVKSTMQHTASVFSDAIAEWENQVKMRVEDGVAIIPVRGAITPDDPFAFFWGETSLSTFNKNFAKALSDKAVKSIVLDVSSPGGYVHGVEATAQAIFAARGQKPIIAFTGSLAASAAYWLISAADKIVLASETSEVGSVGVYMAHFDYSKTLEKMGISVTEITAGKYKGLGSPLAPLTKEEEAVLQEKVDYIYTRFVDTALVRNRDMTKEAALKVANGLTFSGSEAVQAGLADSIQSLQEIIMTQKAGASAETPNTPANAATPAAPVVSEEQRLMAEENARLKAENEAFKAAAAKQSLDAVGAEYSALVKGTLGREATADEITAYQESSEGGRKVMKLHLEEAAKRTDALVKSAKLTQEVAGEGKELASDPNNNPLVKAVRTIQGQAA